MTQPSTETGIVLSRSEKLITQRDEMEPGQHPAPIVPRTFAEVMMMAEALAKADLAPKAMRGKPAEMALVIMTGLEVGLPPMASLRLYTTWDGVPRLMAEGVRAVILRSPHVEYFEVATCDDTHATWIGKRRGRPEKSATWTLERARKAGLMNKETWQKYTQDLLNARASMQLGRILAPDVIAGMVSLEEARDGDFIDVPASDSKAVFVAPPADPAPRRQATRVIGSITEPDDLADRAPTVPPTAPAGCDPGGRSTTSRSNTESSGSPNSFEASSKLAAAVAKVEEKRAPAEVTKDRWGQPIGADEPTLGGVGERPTSGGGSSEPPPTISVGSATPSGENAGDFGAEPKVREFEAWAAAVPRDKLEQEVRPWMAWTRVMSETHKDDRFHKTGELSTRMSQAYARAKARTAS